MCSEQEESLEFNFGYMQFSLGSFSLSPTTWAGVRYQEDARRVRIRSIYMMVDGWYDDKYDYIS